MPQPLFTVSGAVSHGRAVGRKLGFRTINLPCPPDAPADGVYAARVRFDTGEVYDAVLNQGAPPTFPDAPRRIEAHILGDCGDRYGQTAVISYLLYIRPQRAFPSPDALSQAIASDQETARAFFRSIEENEGRR